MTAQQKLHLLLPHPRLWLWSQEARWRDGLLDRWLAGSTQVAPPVADVHSSVARTMGIRALPVAPVSLVGHGVAPGADYWLRADPVVLGADLTNVRLLGWGPSLDERQVSDDVRKRVVAFFEDLGIVVETPHYGEWVLRLPSAVDLVTQPPADWLGASVGDALPGGCDRSEWRTRLTELQMTLHTPGREPGYDQVNSVWLWGGGRLERQLDGSVSPVAAVSPDSYVRGLALLSGGRTYPSLEEIEDLPERLIVDASAIRQTEELEQVLAQVEAVRQQSRAWFGVQAPGTGEWQVNHRRAPWRWVSTKRGLSRWRDSNDREQT